MYRAKMVDSSGPKVKKFKLQLSPEKCHDDIINDLFNKQYHFKNENCCLPAPDSLYTSFRWEIDELQNLKRDLNNIKSKLNDYSFETWHQHTSSRNKAGEVRFNLQKNINPEFLTQAWCKFYENLSSYLVVPDSVKTTKKFTSVHLCEAPGAFITSLNHWLKINMPDVNWNWVGMSLNPYYEGVSSTSAINDDRFIIHTLDNWYFGINDTGNIMNLQNVDALSTLMKTKGNVMLATADGSIDCMDDPGEQEKLVSHLHFCEVVAALSILDSGGTLVLKLFTIFEHETICLIYLLVCMFEEVHAKKPATSKEGNSEIYLICLRFKGAEFASQYLGKLKEHFEKKFNKAMFSLENLPPSFIKQIIECSRFFKDHQCQVILNNISTYRSNQVYYDSSLNKIRQMVPKRYIERCKLRKLCYENERIVQDFTSNKSQCLSWSNRKFRTESFNEICRRKSTKLQDQLVNLIKYMQEVELMAKCYTFELTDELGELSIKEGKPYNKVLNSRFCCPEMLYKLQEFDTIVEKLNLKVPLPASETISLYEKETEEIHKKESKLWSYYIVQFDYLTDHNNLETLNKIYKQFKCLSQGKCLVIFGYSLLSRFNVGLLFILAQAFESLELRLSEALGCIITLRGKKNKETVSEQLNQILSALENAKQQNLTVLTVVPISKLCDNELYPTIIKANSWIIKYCTTCTLIHTTTKMYDIT